MAYWRDIYRFRDSNEYEIKWAGNYGAKGEKRSRRTKATPEQVKKQNRINKTNYVRRKIKLNFEANDYWLTFTFREKQERTSAEVKGYLSKMIGKLRKEYRRAGTELKWISRVEIGKYGGIHAHMIINRIRGETGTDLLIQNAWEHGRVFFSLLYEEGGFKKLAEYLVKPPLEEHQDDKGLDLDITCEASEVKKILKLAEKLKDYEDAEEQGRYIKLPAEAEEMKYRECVHTTRGRTMGRLIDADKLMKHLNDYALTESPGDNESTGERRITKMVYDAIQNCIKAVDERPTAYDVNAVVKQLKYGTKLYLDKDGEKVVLDEVIEIVKAGGADEM